ncbi:RNA methyltransferase [Vicingus serpentipes]|uniref:RNA methyltransferase n=1 Tax=Vicingus serpentipes TaxID=1926625 RepID=A0A5C6S013_9FLAO|nr:RNA methyltransferase [Vicingus serpentipes]TXB66952.1 RNA methyltransferase [Vicingus serpentipes]
MHKKLQNEELNRISVEEFKVQDKTPIIVVLDNIRSLNNIGSVFRTADSFLLEAIYLCGITAQPPHRDIQKTALGATESVTWKYFESTTKAIEDLKQENYKIASIEQTENSVMLNKYTVNKNEKLAIVFGNEVKGVEQEVINNSDVVIEIPQYGTKHSLNISVSAGIVIWELQKQYRV